MYENGYPAWVTYDEGRVVLNTNGTASVNEAYIKDHLGNIRVVYCLQSGSLKTQQVNSYYPFGMSIKELSLNGSATYRPNEYLYNGKMMQDEMGLNLLDYGARFYDAVLGRWLSVDPLSEKYRRWSPYNYCVDNPIRFIDPDGMGPGDLFKSTRKAALDFAISYNGYSIRDNTEYGSSIYTVRKGKQTYYSYSDPNVSKPNEGEVTPSDVPKGTKMVADVHTHGKVSDPSSNDPIEDGFSIAIPGTEKYGKGDIDLYKEQKIIGYVVCPDGVLREFDPAKPDQVANIKNENIPSDPNDKNRTTQVDPPPPPVENKKPEGTKELPNKSVYVPN